ncbi:MAG: cysteine-rich CWC family protein [Porticoccaceae bacterium]
MPRHEIIQCPRCHKAFECKLGSISICHCSSVTLTGQQRERIAEQWNSCLCHACLLAIQRGERRGGE